jgi:GcrA cell cycle regulator
MAWNDERIAKLKQGWENGMTATQIAEMLGEGVTRNAVIGKAHRLGLQSRPSPVKNAPEAAPAPRAAPAHRAAAPAAAPLPAAATPPAPAAAAPDQPASPPRPARPATDSPAPPAQPARPAARAALGKPARTTLLDLNDKVCKWPIGHPGDADFHFCGKPVQPGFPYCGEHCLVAYQAQMPRRDRPRPLPPLPGAPRR